MTGPWRYPPRKQRRASGSLGKAIFAAGILGLILMLAPKAISQAAHDAAACPTLYTEGC